MTTSADHLIPKKSVSVEEIARRHWEYTVNILISSGVKTKVIDQYRFYYINAFVHGYKHGKNDRPT